jgi:hypothetical protein
MSEKKYMIKIECPNWKGYNYALFYAKQYGNQHGGATEAKSKPELIKEIRDIIKEWESFDSILGRMSDKVTRKNLDFQSFTDEVTIGDVFGNTSLLNFGIKVGDTKCPSIAKNV